VSWMIGKSIMEYRFGPAATLMRHLGWDSPAFFTTPWIARLSIAAMDSWVWIPFVMILLLAGLQAMPKEISEAAKVDGATPWQSFWQITFPLMLPVSITAVVIRIIFELKLDDIVINVTAGWPAICPGFRLYRIHTSLARHVSAKHRPYTSRPRSGEREGPIAKQWEGEGRPCYVFFGCAAQRDCRHFHEPLCTKGPGAPHPP